MIKREDAIDAISKLPVKVDDLGYTWMIANDVLKQIDDIPSAEPERKKGKMKSDWTPITECLPEEEEDVLVTVCFDGIEKKDKPTYYVEVAHQIDGEWTSYSDEWKVLRHRHHVVAWMPLPEPYRGE